MYSLRFFLFLLKFCFFVMSHTCVYNFIIWKKSLYSFCFQTYLQSDLFHQCESWWKYFSLFVVLFFIFSIFLLSCELAGVCNKTKENIRVLQHVIVSFSVNFTLSSFSLFYYFSKKLDNFSSFFFFPFIYKRTKWRWKKKKIFLMKKNLCVLTAVSCFFFPRV